MKVKHFTETSNKVEIRINRVRINRSRPVFQRKDLPMNEFELAVSDLYGDKKGGGGLMIRRGV